LDHPEIDALSTEDSRMGESSLASASPAPLAQHLDNLQEFLGRAQSAIMTGEQRTVPGAARGCGR
jgi:hypothetical protein